MEDKKRERERERERETETERMRGMVADFTYFQLLDTAPLKLLSDHVARAWNLLAAFTLVIAFCGVLLL